MSNLIIGNYVAFIGSLILVYAGTMKTKKKMLIFESYSNFVSAISMVILGGYAGALNKIVSVIRNFLCYEGKLNLKKKIILSVLVCTLPIFLNSSGFVFLNLLPVTEALIHLWFATVKSVKRYKILLIFTLLMWLVYHVYILCYLSAIFDFVDIVVNLVLLVRMNESKNRKHYC